MRAHSLAPVLVLAAWSAGAAQALSPELERAARSGDPAKRRQAMARLGGVPGLRPLEILLEHCWKDENPFVRDEASQSLVARREDRETLACLARELERCLKVRRDREQAAALLEILGRTGSATLPALPALEKALANQEPELRALAAWALGRSRLPQAFPLLRARLPAEKEPRIRGLIADGLGRTGRAEASEPLEALAAEVEPLVAVPALGALRLADRGRTLRLSSAACAAHRAPAVRLQAVANLAWLKELAGVPALISVLETSTGRLVREAREALVAVTGMKHGLDPLSWRHWWETEGKSGAAGKTAPMSKDASGDRGWGYYHGHQVSSDRLVFLIDASGSMREPHGTDRRSRYEHACDALEQLFSGMPPETRFNVILFMNQVLAWEKELASATEEARRKAVQFARRYSPGGATNLHDALVQALRTPGVDTLYLLTDGVPTEGPHVLRAPLLIAVARENLFALARIHTISLSGTRESRELLARIARENGGESR